MRAHSIKQKPEARPGCFHKMSDNLLAIDWGRDSQLKAEPTESVANAVFMMLR